MGQSSMGNRSFRRGAGGRGWQPEDEDEDLLTPKRRKRVDPSEVGQIGGQRGFNPEKGEGLPRIFGVGKNRR